MTVSSSGDRVSSAGNGSTTVFAFPYYFLDDDDLTVIVRVNSTGVETVQTIATHYTVLGAGDSAGGSVTMLTAPASGETLTLLRELDATQELDLVENDALPAESLEQALDKLTMLAQQSLSTADRAILVPKTDSAALSTTLPSSVTRASKYFGFNASGEPVALDPPSVDDTSLVVVAGTEPEQANGRIWVDTSTVGWLIWSQSDGTDYQEMFRTSTADGALQIAQSIVMDGATGGDPGAGKINAAGIEINGIDLSPSQPANVLVNGNFDVWQRGSAATSSAAGSRTFLADRFYVNPTGAAVNQARSTTVPDGKSRYSLELTGAASVTTVLIGQRVEAHEVVARLKGTVTFAAYVYNGSGAAFVPSLLLGTPDTADDFTTVTNRLTQTLQSCADGAWTRVTHSVDISAYTDLANGLQVEMQIPSGSLVSGDTVRASQFYLAQTPAFSVYESPALATEQVRCFRFMYVVGGLIGEAVGVGQCATTTTASIFVAYPVPMRVAPTITLSANSDFNITNASAGTIAVTGQTPSGLTARSVRLGPTVASGLVAGNATQMLTASADARAYFNAEL